MRTRSVPAIALTALLVLLLHAVPLGAGQGGAVPSSNGHLAVIVGLDGSGGLVCLIHPARRKVPALR